MQVTVSKRLTFWNKIAFEGLVLMFAHLPRKIEISIIICLLLLVKPLEASEWLQIVKSQSGSYWIKAETVARAGSKISVQQLTDYNARQSTGKWSGLAFVEINCANFTLRETRYLTYSKNKASGRLLSDDDLIKYGLAKWRTAEKNTADGILVEWTCKSF